MEQKKMRISVRVRSGAARFRVGIQAPSIREALALAGSSYPRGDVSLVLPIEPEGFFVHGPSGPARLIGDEQIPEVAA
jgi:hypothetical protein